MGWFRKNKCECVVTRHKKETKVVDQVCMFVFPVVKLPSQMSYIIMKKEM